MTYASVTTSETDNSQLPTPFPGVYGALAIPDAVRGPQNKPVLCASPNDVLTQFSMDGSIPVGASQAYWQAMLYLARGNKLWIVNPQNTGSLSAGLQLNQAGYTAPAATKTLGNGSTLTAATPVVTNAQAADLNDTYVVTFTSPTAYGIVDAKTPSNNVSNATYTSGTAISLGSGMTVALSGAPVAGDIVTVASSGNTPTALTQGLPLPLDGYSFTGEGAVLIAAKDPRAWGNRLSVLPTLPSKSEFAGHVNLAVYVDSTLVETWKVTRQQVLSGNGTSAYIEDVLLGSTYITAIDNLAVEPTVQIDTSKTTMTALSGGVDGTATTAGQIELAYDLFLNESAYPVTLLLDTGDSADSTKLNLIAVAEERGDCVALISVNYATMANSGTYATDAVTWRDENLNSNSSYGAVYGPTTLIEDSYNNKQIYVGSSGFAAAAINFTYQNYQLWVPPAGYTRGAMLNALDVQWHLSDTDMSTLYDGGINPIRFTDNGDGIVIWGQKTLSFPPSAEDRVNVRLLLCVLKPGIEEYLEGQLFNLNDATQRLNIVNQIDAYLAGIMGKGGLYNYTVVCDSTNNTDADIDNYTLNVQVRIQPAKGIEFINQDMVIDPTGVTYSS
jgi:phage tail sheath protein FI